MSVQVKNLNVNGNVLNYYGPNIMMKVITMLALLTRFTYSSLHNLMIGVFDNINPHSYNLLY